MYSFKIAFFLLALFVAVIDGLPVDIHGHARRSHGDVLHRRAPNCPNRARRGPGASATSLVAAASGTPAVNAQADSNKASSTNDDDDKASSTKSAKESEETNSSSSSSNKATGLLGSLFPVDQAKQSWSTAEGADNQVPLSDSTFNPTKLLSALSHDYVTKEGKKAMKAHYPEGSYTFTHEPKGGISFYAPGPDKVDLTTAKEATFGYSVFFPDGFEGNMGGKLPGLYGGDNDDVAVSCSGGRRDHRCFSARLMWREDLKGELYTYLPSYEDPGFGANKKQCNVKPESDCNPTYGASVGRGAFKFATGKWTSVSQRVKLNDAGKANGELELFVGGDSVIKVNGLIIRASDAGRIRGIQMQTFFGGSGKEWASPKDQDVFFADFSVAVTETF